MSQDTRNHPPVEDLISTGEDTLGSSISLSVGENSIRIKEKPKANKEPVPALLPVKEKNEVDKWWLKRPETRLGVTSPKNLEIRRKPSPSPSPDVSSSMAEFLEKEKLCKALYKSEGEVKDKDDTLCDILASAAFDKYPSDFENATDEDIGSILEEMSKIAGALSPNSGPEQTKSGNSSKNPTEEERSVEELLEEAEKLVKRTSSSISKSNSRSDTLVSERSQNANKGLDRVRQLEADIFQMIEEEVHKESEKIKRSPKYEKKRDSSPGLEVVYENVNLLKPPKTLELQKKKFEEQKVEISSSSDLDDPIERHSKSEELKTKKENGDKDNLQKEITDVDKDFFENLLKKSKDKSEGVMSGSSSFGQEDFSHFLKILQGHSDNKGQESKISTSIFNFPKKTDDKQENTRIERELNIQKSPVFPEKEISEILRRELPQVAPRKVTHEISESDSSSSAGRSRKSERSAKREATFSRHSSVDRSNDSEVTKKVAVSSRNSSVDRTKDPDVTKKVAVLSRNSSEDSGRSSSSRKDAKVVNSKNELYTVGLTPRLELFADAIPKLIAEKSSENLRKMEREKMEKEKIMQLAEPYNLEAQGNRIDFQDANGNNKARNNDSNTDAMEKGKTANVHRISLESLKPDEVSNSSENKSQKREVQFAKSKSCDQITKPISNLRLSLDDMKSAKSVESSRKPPTPISKRSPILRPKLHPKPVSKFASKVKLSPKPKKDLPKSGPASTSTLTTNTKKMETKTNSESLLKNSMAGGDMRRNFSKSDWEVLCHEEKHKNYLLKEQLDSEAKLYKTQIEGMRTSFEEELFALKKQNIILKAKVDELSLNEKRPEVHSKNDTKVLLLERELEKQESLIQAYETENKKLIQETKHLQEEIKNLHQKQKATTIETSEKQKLNDQIKDLQEDTLKLNLEISELKSKINDYALKYEDVNQQNSLLSDELDMFKEQLKNKNNFITDQLQIMTTSELDLKKQLENVKFELSSKSEQLKSTKFEFDKLQQCVLPLEKEVLEFRVKESNLIDKLQVAKSHIEREKQLSQKLKDQVILDNKKIMDLNRQVREMERILRRKNPDSVSALILTANSDHEKISTEKLKLLEDRIALLESEIKQKEEISQEKLLDFQKKFTEMKERYVTQVMELEGKLLEATVRNQKVYNDMFTQTTTKFTENKGVETTKNDDRDKAHGNEREEKKELKPMKTGPKSQNLKEDTHLIATIRGLKLELSHKDKTVLKITKDFQELQKTNRRLQKEREKLLNDKRMFRSVDFDKMGRSTAPDSRPASSKTSENNDQNSNFCQNGNSANHASNQRLGGSTQRLYNPLQFSENSDSSTVKKLTEENDILKEELNKINKDFMTLKNKRLHDLNLLQEEHEREMAALVKEYSVKFGDSKVVKLQGQINTQTAVISHLKQQIEKLRDYKEQVIVLKAERDHLENRVKSLNEKVKYLSTPSTDQLQLLQDKITMLQQRHESREMTLQNLVRDLLRTKTQCIDCKGERGKNKQLCYFRQELDHILGMLQEIANVY